MLSRIVYVFCSQRVDTKKFNELSKIDTNCVRIYNLSINNKIFNKILMQ